MVYGLWSIGTRTVVYYAMLCCVCAAKRRNKKRSAGDYLVYKDEKDGKRIAQTLLFMPNASKQTRVSSNMYLPKGRSCMFAVQSLHYVFLLFYSTQLSNSR